MLVRTFLWILVVLAAVFSVLKLLGVIHSWLWAGLAAVIAAAIVGACLGLLMLFFRPAKGFKHT